jgi:hypothetical protein
MREVIEQLQLVVVGGEIRDKVEPASDPLRIGHAAHCADLDRNRLGRCAVAGHVRVCFWWSLVGEWLTVRWGTLVSVIASCVGMCVCVCMCGVCRKKSPTIEEN